MDIVSQSFHIFVRTRKIWIFSQLDLFFLHHAGWPAGKPHKSLQDLAPLSLMRSLPFQSFHLSATYNILITDYIVYIV